jgi:hypothetical protein
MGRRRFHEWPTASGHFWLGYAALVITAALYLARLI